MCWLRPTCRDGCSSTQYKLSFCNKQIYCNYINNDSDAGRGLERLQPSRVCSTLLRAAIRCVYVCLFF